MANNIRDALYKCMSNEIVETTAKNSQTILLFTVGANEAFSLSNYITLKSNTSVLGYIKIELSAGVKDAANTQKPYYKLEQCALYNNVTSVEFVRHPNGNDKFDYYMIVKYSTNVIPTIIIKKDLTNGDYIELLSSAKDFTRNSSTISLVSVEPDTEITDNGRYFSSDDGEIKIIKATPRNTNLQTGVEKFDVISGKNIVFYGANCKLIGRTTEYQSTVDESTAFFIATPSKLTYSGTNINITGTGTIKEQANSFQMTATAEYYLNTPTFVVYGSNVANISSKKITLQTGVSSLLLAENGDLTYNRSGDCFKITADTIWFNRSNYVFNNVGGTGTTTFNFSNVVKFNNKDKVVVGDAIATNNAVYLPSVSDLKLARIKDIYYSKGSTNITTLGTVTTGTWNGSVIDSKYLPSSTTYETNTQTFENKKFKIGTFEYAPGTIISKNSVNELHPTSTASDIDVPTEKAIATRLNDILGDQVLLSYANGTLTFTIKNQNGTF